MILQSALCNLHFAMRRRRVAFCPALQRDQNDLPGAPPYQMRLDLSPQPLIRSGLI